MAQFPAAFSCQAASPSSTRSPYFCTAKSMIEVVPPQAAARVPVSKVSEALVPPKGSSMCVCASTPPGITYLPVASITVAASIVPSAVEPGESRATIFSPSTSTSAVVAPVALTTVPFLIRTVMVNPSRLGDLGVRVRPAVPVELPVVAHLPDHVQVQVADQQFLLLAAAHFADEVAARIDDLAGAV